jgi:hypothetical protein
MYDLQKLLESKPFSLDKDNKFSIFNRIMSNLSAYHYENCPEYRRICDILHNPMPFIPVRLFKQYELLSVDRSKVVKTMTSSGTTGQAVSKIFLDKETAAMQTKVLAAIMSGFNGGQRLPMLIIDSKSILKDRKQFSARGAGILGFSLFGRDITYALDENMDLDLPAIENFLERNSGSQIFIFGFTFMIWKHFYIPLAEKSIKLDINNGFLLHGGGWKKLMELSISSEQFKHAVNSVTGISNIHNYYGMVEQTGSIFMECEHGRLHSSIFSDINIINHVDFSVNPVGKRGLIQLMSVIPKSYPGHCLLSEDEGILLGEDDCPCGRFGKTFTVLGRIKNAEIRGCSDTYE